MLLRDHPLMQYRGVPNWPPNWTWIDGPKKSPQGEIGILREVAPTHVFPADRCFLYVDHEGSSYIGCLLFDDHVFCKHITEVLQFYCNRPITEIGSLEF